MTGGRLIAPVMHPKAPGDSSPNVMGSLHLLAVFLCMIPFQICCLPHIGGAIIERSQFSNLSLKSSHLPSSSSTSPWGLTLIGPDGIMGLSLHQSMWL